MKEEQSQQVYVVDDDERFRNSLCYLLEENNLNPVPFSSAEHFLDNLPPANRGCLLLDLRMTGISGLELQAELKNRKFRIPIIFISGHGDIQTAVHAVKLGAFDFIEKPFKNDQLIQLTIKALNSGSVDLQKLSPRETEVFDHLVEGQISKTIAAEIGISERTVEFHRGNIMKKLNASTLAELISLSKVD